MERTVLLLKALAEPTRLRVVALCRIGGDLTVSEFVRILGQSQPRVSRHLRLLTEAGALLRIPEGNWVFYRINEDGPVSEIVDALIANVPSDDTTLSRDRDRLTQVKRERAQAAESYFSANAEAWGEIRAMHVDQAEVNATLQRLIGDGPIGSLLDIGTGTGEMLKVFAARIARGEGIDQSREMLAVARASLEAEGLAHCHVRHGDLYSLPYEDASFDVVVLHQVLHYIDDIAGALTEAGRVLAPGGRLAIADFAPHDIEELRAQHQHRRLGFAANDLDAGLERAGLTVKDITHLSGEPLTVSIWLAQKPGRVGNREAAA